jgi:molecular chaperone GrpE
MFETPPVPSPEEEPVTSRDESGEESGEQSGERAVPASHPNSGERAVPASHPNSGERAVPASLPNSGEEDPSNEEQRLPEQEAEDLGGEQAVPASPGDLARLERERDEYLGLAQRAQADFENYRKRAAREAAAAGERAKSGLVRELLPVVDNLERALNSAEASEQHLAEGVRLVHSELIAVLERNGVQQFDPRGDRFDPGEHEALSMRSQDGAEPGVVLDVVEKGYRSNGTVLRPARVVVSG